MFFIRKLSGAPTKYSYFSAFGTFLNNIYGGVKQKNYGHMLIYLIQQYLLNASVFPSSFFL